MSRIGTSNLTYMLFHNDECLTDTDINVDIPEEYKENSYIFKARTSLDFDQIIYGNLSNKYIMYVVKSSCTSQVLSNLDVFDILREVSSIRALNDSINGIDFYFFNIEDSMSFEEYIEERRYICPSCGSDLRECGIWRNVTQHFDFSLGNERFEHDSYDDAYDDGYYCRDCNTLVDTEDIEIRE